MVRRVDKIKIYIFTSEPSAVDYSDMHSLEHPCSQAGERAFEGMKYMPVHSSGFISDEERKAIDLVDRLSKESGLDYEIIDLAKSRQTTRLKFVMKGWKVPVISIGKETIIGLPTKEQLECVLRSQAC